MTRTELMGNIDVVLCALLHLGGDQRKVHTEDVAFEAFKLAPERFGWLLQKYQEKGFPDKELVRTALRHAKERPERPLRGRSGIDASGKNTDGWMFTPAGVVWIRENLPRIEEALGIARPRAKPLDAARLIKRVKDEPLFRRFTCGQKLGEADRYAFTDMLNSSPDAPTRVVTAKFQRLCTLAETAADPDVKAFLAECSRAFARLLETTDGNGIDEEGE